MKKIGILLALFLFLPFVIAQPPITPIVSMNPTNGLDIFFANFEDYQVGNQIKFHFHVVNKSNGIQMTTSNTDCLFHLYNATSHMMENMTLPGDSNGIEWDIPIIPEVYNNKGVYSYYIYCNSTTLDGGAVKEGFMVADLNELGVPKENTNLLAIVIANIFLIAILILMGVLGKSMPTKFFPFAIALFESIFLIGILWVNQANGNMIFMLRLNFIIMILVSAFFGLINLYRYVLEMMNIHQEDKEDENKWGEKPMFGRDKD